MNTTTQKYNIENPFEKKNHCCCQMTSRKYYYMKKNIVLVENMHIEEISHSLASEKKMKTKIVYMYSSNLL